jgi:short-subunit dehydrogenase
MKLEGRTALVTGASSGIGSEFARQLGAMGATLVISARRKERLDALAEEIREQHGVEVRVVVADLSDPAAAARMFDELEGEGTAIDVLINNAGFGIQAPFLDVAWESTRQQMQLNMTSLTELCWRFGSAMRERGQGRILNVSSIGAYQPVPQFATYAAGKAYVRNFSEALAYELAGSGVQVCCLCPGGTATEFSDVAGQDVSGPVKALLMSAEDCAAIGLRALFRGRRNIISGLSNKISCWLLRFLPRRTMVWAAALVMSQTAPKLSTHDP